MTTPILITGANGFLGRAIVTAALQRGRTVRALVLPNESTPAEWENRVDVVRGDVTDSASVRGAVAGCSVVHHLAAVVGDAGPEALHQRVTVGGTERVVEACVAEGVRLVLASSITVYGDRIVKQLCDENTPMGTAQGPYSRAKQAQELTVMGAKKSGELSAVIIRPANIYGPDSGPWFLDLLRELRRGTPAILGDGSGNAGLAYVDNVAELFFTVGEMPHFPDHPLIAVDGLDVSWQQYVSDVARVADLAPPKHLPLGVARVLAPVLETTWNVLHLKGRPPLTREAFNLVGHANRFDNSLTRAATGWAPRVGYSEGLRVMGESLGQGAAAR
jgi:nucleoside-diphosphate-sugar epimerase